MPRRSRISLFALLFMAALLCAPFRAAADSEPLAAPAWTEISNNADGSKTLAIVTPTYMLDSIDFYEYSWDAGQTWHSLNDRTGGEFLINETCDFSLRYVSGNNRSETTVLSIAVNKITAVTSSSTEITLLLNQDSQTPKDVTLSAYEIITGKDYTLAQTALGNENIPFTLFYVSVMRNYKVYTLEEPEQWLFPVGDFDLRYCKLYHMSEKGTLTRIETTPELTVLYGSTEKTGWFLIAEDKTFCPGDVNGDALVSAADARLALRAAVQLETLTQQQKKSADIDGDEAVTAQDARFILRLAIGLEKI